MNDTTATISVLRRIHPPLLWEPVPGNCVDAFFTRKTSEPGGPSREKLEVGPTSTLAEAQRVLGRCLPPTGPAGQETGLVVGYVQSGKTLSFTTVISLARDNRYGLVVVLAGTKENLLDQSEKRLRKDLGIDKGGSPWLHLSGPRVEQAAEIQRCLSSWAKNPVKGRAVLITLLKEKQNLGHLQAVLEKVSLQSVPALIIDDEGDQASLNTKANKNLLSGGSEFSTIFEKIADVRAAVPHHTYLQYTATPQANLLLAQTDFLNPSFAELLTPGDAYTGGAEFFGTGRPLTEVIPVSQVPSKTQKVSAIPKSLASALRYFFLVAAQHSLTLSGEKDYNRSMMVHPAQQTSSHRQYKKWVDRWRDTVANSLPGMWQRSPKTVEEMFSHEYNSLKATFPTIRPLAELMQGIVDDVLEDQLKIVEVNSTKEAEKRVDWNAYRYWILVGGQKLDRGFTVEGLCTTYMPRGLSSSPAADTLQQRARFFGYKRSYLGLCRVFLQADVRDAFTDYVEHEKSVRSALEKCRGRPLRDWRRAFLLNEGLRPTRRNVIGRAVRQVRVHEWLQPKALQRDESAVKTNRVVLSKAVERWEKNHGPSVSTETFDAFKSSKGRSLHRLIEGVPLRAILEDFLLQIQVRDPMDAELHSGALIAFASILDAQPDASADVFLMNALQMQYRTRDWNGKPPVPVYAPINNYFSASADTVNDKTLHSESRVTLQLRRFKLGTIPRDESSADVFDIPWFVLHIPKNIKKGVLLERD